MKRTGHYKHIGQNVTCIACALFFSSGSLAQTIENDVSKTTSTISNASTTSVENTLTMQALASQWNLDVEEYSRYEKLMQGPLGKWNPHIDPLLALGMFAQSPEEERRFAERYAQQEFELTQRAIHFQQTYRAAFNRLYPNTSVINDALLQPYFQHRQAKLGTNTPSSQLSQRLFKNGDTLMYFPKQGSQKRLREMKQLVRLLSGLENANVEVFVRGATDDRSVQQWAAENNVDPQWLQQGILTLNRDEGLYAKLQSKSGLTTETQFYLRRQNRFYELAMDDLGL